MGTPRSAAARNVSPARTPSPPLYVGMLVMSPISIEKYATTEPVGVRRALSAMSVLPNVGGTRVSEMMAVIGVFGPEALVLGGLLVGGPSLQRNEPRTILV